MRIRRIRIHNFRKLRGCFVIDGLKDGLTVIAGDNEEGKSTILSAIQTVFFNRHRLTGEAANAMQPFGSAVRPEISVDFELNGESYALRKAYCQNPEAELTGPGGRASGEAVEERLQVLLRFEPPGKGAAKAEHRGTWGLFWVDQGTSFTCPRLGVSGRETFVSALESEVGQVLGGERGRALIAVIAQKNDAFFTTRTGRPKGPYKDSLDWVPALKVEVDAIRSRLREYDGKTDELGRVRARLRAYADDRSLEIAENKLRSAKEAQKTLASLQSALADAETNQKLALADLNGAQASWKSREDKITAIRITSDLERAYREGFEANEGALAIAKEQKRQLQSAFDTAKEHLSSMDGVLAACERALQRARAKQECDELQGHFSKASDAKSQFDALRSQAKKIRVDAGGIAELRGLEGAADKVILRLQSIATKLTFAPEGRRGVAVDGNAIPPDQPLLLTEQSRLTLEGFGGLIVTPGGEDLAPLRNDAARAKAQLDEAFNRLDVADVAAAEKLLNQRTQLLADARVHEAAINAHAAGGIEALRQKVTLKEAELAELSQGLSQGALDVDKAELHRDAARAKRDDTKATLDRAETVLKDAESLHLATRDEWLTAQADLGSAQRQLKLSQAALDDERGRISDADLQAALRERSDQHERAENVLAERRSAVDKSNPEEIRLRLQTSEQALTTTRSDIEKLTGQTRDLEVELRTLGQTGLGEQLQEKEGELARARDGAARIEREARATRLLLETLSSAERQAKETFLGPVRERITPYLRLLFPDAEVVLGEDDLGISHLRRDGIDEPFESLSVGTREQLAVLTRLAFAEFLRDKGRSAAVILDDALAYSDDARFERMQLVLRKAAEKLQVIVLTCRERDYHSLGVPIIRLVDCNRE